MITGWNWLELVITGWIERLGLSFGGPGRGAMKKMLARITSDGFSWIGLAVEWLGSEELGHGLLLAARPPQGEVAERRRSEPAEAFVSYRLRVSILSVFTGIVAQNVLLGAEAQFSFGKSFSSTRPCHRAPRQVPHAFGRDWVRGR